MKFSNTFYLSTSLLLLVGCVSVTDEGLLPDEMNADGSGGGDQGTVTGGAPSTGNTGGAVGATGGAPAATGGGDAATGGGDAATGGAAATGGSAATGGGAATGGAPATGSCETCSNTVAFEDIKYETPATVGSCVTYDGATYLKTGAQIAYSEPQCPPGTVGREAWCDMMKPEHQYEACP